MATIQMPIRYAGPGEWTVFARPVRYESIAVSAAAVPGTRGVDRCVVVPAGLWEVFSELSLWIEALCIRPITPGRV